MFNIGMHQLISRKTFTGDTHLAGGEAAEHDDVDDFTDSRVPSGSSANAHGAAASTQVGSGEEVSEHPLNNLDNNRVTAGSFANAHDFNIYGPTMIETQNIHNHTTNDPPLSPLRTTIPCTSSNFVGQETYLERLREYFAANNNVERKIFLLYGMGGIGKTQICLKFADEMNVRRFAYVFWIDATSENTISLSLKEIFKKISVPGTPASSFSPSAALNKIVMLDSDWLMIYDNADGAPELVESFLPPGNKGNILITSRNPAHKRLTSCETSAEVSEMSNEAAIELILKTSHSDMHSRENREAAQKIVNVLNHHPLAIDMAGAYIMQTLCHIQNFLGIYNKYRPKILNNERLQGASTYHKTVYKTLEMSFNTITKMANETDDEEKTTVAKYAMILVNISAFLHNENISYEMFKRAAKHHNEEINQGNDLPTYLTILDKSILSLNEDGEWDEYIFHESISLLYSFSLIKKTISAKSYSIHSLVQTYCQDRMSVEQKEMWILNSNATIVGSVSDKMSSDTYIYQNGLIPHLLRNLDNKKHLKYYDDLYKGSADILRNSGLYKIEEMFRLDIVNAHLENIGEANHNIANNFEYVQSGTTPAMHMRLTIAVDRIIDLSTCLYRQGRWIDAEQLEVYVLSVREIIFGKEHPATLMVLHMLALTYRRQGKLAQAEQLQTKVLSMMERILGEKHPVTLRVMYDLAGIYNDQGRWSEAEQLQKKVLQSMQEIIIRNEQERILHGGEVAFDEEHMEALRVMHNLAVTYYNQGKWTEAETFLVKVLSMHERILGKENPETLGVMNALASNYQCQGKHAEAEQLHIKILAIQEIILGSEHADTLGTMNNLAIAFRNQGRMTEAEQLQLKVLNVRERILGTEHPLTLRVMYNLALNYSFQKRWTEAEPRLINVLNMQKRILGKEHPETCKSLDSLRHIYQEQGKFKELFATYSSES